ncbi:S24 family peptidase [Pedobacter sp. WC2423]|uniref:LexA family transcriptional regulator n=1 Tax=Pedobacter sp. WC2423 TaxID=3234142 RepID=UPI0034663771
MSTVNRKSLILNEIKLAYNLSSDRKFADFLGIAPTTLSSWHKRDTFDYDLLYSKCVGINAEFLLSGTGNVIKEIDDNTVTTRYILRTDTSRELQTIPLYDLNAAASLVALFEGHQNIIDYISIPNLPKSDGAIYVSGDSMYPLLKAGDIAIYKKIYDMSEGIRFGEMHIVSAIIDGDLSTVVKFVKKSDKGEDWILLVSQNPHHASRDIHMSKIKAIAIVKASIRLNSMM